MKDKVLLERVGASLRKQRESSGLSQEAFADQIGMHRTYYSAIERGENNLTLRTLRRVCAGLGTKMWEVLRDGDL
jgi:transcriptional regulator with XRE-family HTH domain